MVYKYHTVVVGGTFDRLHAGHIALLHFAFSLGKYVYVTITSDVYTSAHKPFAAPFEERKKTVEEFLQKERIRSRATVVSIDDVYGITSKKQASLQAIVVTKNSIAGAKKVNKKRISIGLSPLDIVLMPLIKTETGLPLSATNIRGGLFDPKGQLTVKKDIMKHVAYLPQALREKLHKPFGVVTQDVSASLFINTKKIIAIGDVTTRKLYEKKITPILSFVDFYVERKKQPDSLSAIGFSGKEKVYHAKNPAGTITPSLWEVSTKALQEVKKNRKVVVIIEGEEDLAVIPVLLLMPVGFAICYGQPHEGMVIVQVTNETKRQALEVILNFTQGSTRGY